MSARYGDQSHATGTVQISCSDDGQDKVACELSEFSDSTCWVLSSFSFNHETLESKVGMNLCSIKRKKWICNPKLPRQNPLMQSKSSFSLWWKDPFWWWRLHLNHKYLFIHLNHKDLIKNQVTQYSNQIVRKIVVVHVAAISAVKRWSEERSEPKSDLQF